MNTVKVAVNVSELTVSGLLNKARLVSQRVTDNPNQFPSCVPANTRVIQGIADLEAAEAEAGDGAKSKVAYMRDKQQVLVKLMGVLGHYIETDADGDESIVHLSGLDVKKKGVPVIPEFKIEQGEHAGSVSLKIKARAKTIYKWQYCQSAFATGPWTDAARTSGCKALITNLSPGIYWFRVVFVDAQGEHEQPPVSFAVN
jgi:hypothetical protein